ncbi:MAG: glyoxalase [Candidatus Sulfotelmatobacter sp.]|nr:glyoxalase [Candidatus Sulfotelmatobacter sp.]
MRINKIIVGTCVALVLTLGLAVGSLHVNAVAQSAQTAETVSVAVGPQYDTTHVYVPAADFDRFVASVLQTFGGKTGQDGVLTVTPTPSTTRIQLVLTPVGTLSVFGFKTPVPYPFGSERTGYLVTDMDEAVRSAKATGADVFVAPFNDPIGKDAIIQWSGGVNTQLYWHATAPSYTPLQTIPENRVYVSPDRVDAFVRSFLAFSHGTVLSDDAQAPGVEIGRPAETYRRVRIQSKFGKLTALVTDGHLPYPYGREMTGYEVANLAEIVTKAKAAGADVVVPPYKTDERDAFVVRFPGGYIAEIHSVTKK